MGFRKKRDILGCSNWRKLFLARALGSPAIPWCKSTGIRILLKWLTPPEVLRTCSLAWMRCCCGMVPPNKQLRQSLRSDVVLVFGTVFQSILKYGSEIQEGRLTAFVCWTVADPRVDGPCSYSHHCLAHWLFSIPHPQEGFVVADARHGRRFGNGVYLAEDLTKSLDYCKSAANGVNYVLLCRPRCALLNCLVVRLNAGYK